MSTYVSPLIANKWQMWESEIWPSRELAKTQTKQRTTSTMQVEAMSALNMHWKSAVLKQALVPLLQLSGLNIAAQMSGKAPAQQIVHQWFRNCIAFKFAADQATAFYMHFAM